MSLPGYENIPATSEGRTAARLARIERELAELNKFKFGLRLVDWVEDESSASTNYTTTSATFQAVGADMADITNYQPPNTSLPALVMVYAVANQYNSAGAQLTLKEEVSGTFPTTISWGWNYSTVLVPVQVQGYIEMDPGDSISLEFYHSRIVGGTTNTNAFRSNIVLQVYQGGVELP